MCSYISEGIGRPDVVRRRMQWVIDLYDGAWKNRLDAPRRGLRITVMQRVDYHDLAGELIRRGAYGLVLPLEYNPDLAPEHGGPPHPQDPRRRAGELISGRWDALFVQDNTRTPSQRRKHRTLYNQQPEDASTLTLFRPKEWGLYRLHPRQQVKGCDEVVLTVDCTFTSNPSSDRVSLRVWGRRGTIYYLLHSQTEQLSFLQTLQAIRLLKQSWPEISLTLIELAANGYAVVEVIETEIVGAVGFSVGKYGSKVARATRLAAAFEAFQIRVPLPEHAPWLAEYMETFREFTGKDGGRDDEVDAASQMLLYIELHRPRAEGETLQDAVEQFDQIFPEFALDVEDGDGAGDEDDEDEWNPGGWVR